MKVGIVGLWHLGTVTAACLAKAGHSVIAFDPNQTTIQNLKNNKAPIFEPELEDLLLEAKSNLSFTHERSDLQNADIIWVTFDTPVNDQDEADVDFVLQEVKAIFPHVKKNILVIISSQLPVGSIQKLQALTKNITFACIPENLRLGKAIGVFMHPDRIVVGLDDLKYQSQVEKLLNPITDKLIWMSIVSAEMTKHAINSFLAISVTFINELSALCETVGANAKEVEMGLKSEERIGPKAYLRPGDAIAGGTLMRDIHYLTQLGKNENRHTYLLSAIVESNNYHKQWCCRKLLDLWRDLRGKRIAVLGLTYKAGTDTLRRSTAIETCAWLHQQGMQVHAYDPVINKLPDEFAEFIQIKNNIKDTLTAADGVIVSTAWPEFRDVTADEFIANLKNPLVLDPSGFISKNIAQDSRIKYFSVGVPT